MKIEKNFETIKKEVNEEGFESEGEGGAAVLIGKKEDMPRLKERLETEGRTKDLGSYIRLHKEIFLPKEEIDPVLSKR